MKSKPLSPPPAICGSNVRAREGSLLLPSGRNREEEEEKKVSSILRVTVPKSTCFHGRAVEVE